jgi:hypothetical protein
MVLGDVANIREVILFPALRPERDGGGEERAEGDPDDVAGGGGEN